MTASGLTWTGIVKVQRQLNFPKDASVCIYNQDGSIYYIDKMTPELLRMFGDDLKFYAQADLVGTIINIQDRAPSQDW